MLSAAGESNDRDESLSFRGAFAGGAALPDFKEKNMERQLAAEHINDLMQAQSVDAKLSAIIGALVAILRELVE